MSSAGPPEYLPLLCRDGTLFTDGERHQYPAIGVILERIQHAIPQRHAHAVHPIHEAGRVDWQLRVHAFGADITGCTNISLQRPRLKIKSVRIHGAVRTLEPYGEMPALPGRQYRHSFLGIGLAISFYVPRE